jgi:hypothetical protein
MRASANTTVTAEGWVTDDAEQLRFFLDHPPPRPFGYLDQMKVDAGSRRALTFWAAGLGAITVGVAAGQWPLVIGGLCVVGAYIRCLWLVVPGRRNAPVRTGVIQGWDPPGVVPRHVTADARLPDGVLVRVALHESGTGGGVAEHPGPAEVVFLYEPTTTYSLVLAVRPLGPGTVTASSDNLPAPTAPM